MAGLPRKVGRDSDNRYSLSVCLRVCDAFCRA